MPKPKRPWTVMVYLAGDNNLSEECVYGLTEMKKADCGSQINVIAQFDPSDDFIRTRRYEINKGGVDGPLTADILEEARFNSRTKEVHFKTESRNANKLARARRAGNAQKLQIAKIASRNGEGLNADPPPDFSRGGRDDTNTASPVTLYNFLSFCIQEYPAYHYMVVLSGHGAGTERDYLLKDDSSAGYLTFNELKLVFEQLKSDLEDGQIVDILGLDSCLMSMAEVCYELRETTQMLIGCESYAPAAGWPYRPILERLKELVKAEGNGPRPARRDDMPAHFAQAIVEEYMKSYADYVEGGLSVAQSALDVTRVSELRGMIKELAKTLIREVEREQKREQKKTGNEKTTFPFKDALILAHWEAQSYNGEWYVDIVDFCECLSRRYLAGDVARVCRKVARFVADEFVLRSSFSGPVYQYSNGLSIYFPWSTVAPFYLNVDFATATNWAEFLAVYTDFTRRKPREQKTATAASRKHFVDVVASNASLSTDEFSLLSGRMGSGRMGSGRMGSGRMGSGRMGSGRMGSGKMGSGREGNPIHSMRNPPFELDKLDGKHD